MNDERAKFDNVCCKCQNSQDYEGCEIVKIGSVITTEH
jgi:hypothetical protein